MRSVVLVEPEIPENTGFIARLASNFGYNLKIVSPDFNLSEARNTAKNCQEKLRNAEIFDSVEEAIEDLEYVVGTKPGKGQELSSFQPRRNTSIMIGRESNGLSSDELELCDAVVHIGTEEYSSINQSHATSILMYSMSEREEKSGINKDQKQILEKKLSKPLFETVLNANPSKEQIGQILAELEGE